MTKKEKLEYFRLIEPKLREKFLIKGEMLSNDDFGTFNIKGKDIELFKEKYEELWEDELFKLLVDDDVEFSGMLEEYEDLLISEDFGELTFFDFPEDKYFYQLGVPKLDIKDFKLYLQCHTKIIYINKITGKIIDEAYFKLENNSIKNNVDDYIRLVIDDPEIFLKMLKNGQIDEILGNERNVIAEWIVSQSHPFSKAFQNINIENLISVLTDRRQWILYIDWYMIKNERFDFMKFRSFENFMEIKEFELEAIEKIEKEFIDEFLKNRFFFKVENPIKMRNELVKGNMKILDEIKNITFSEIFFTNKNEA